MRTIIELNSLKENIYIAASERGLTIFDGEPNFKGMPFVEWSGDWLDFLELAKEVKSHLLYVYEQRYDPDEVIVEETGDPSIIGEENEDENEPHSVFNSESEEKKWLLARIRENITPWENRRGEVISVRCEWIKENVAHHWHRYADWIFDCREAIVEVIDEAEQVENENRVLRTKESAQKLHEYATLMAQHPRFPEATSEEKRGFMANQLFPELDNDQLLGYGTAISIARRAVLIYWWDIEPLEKVSKIERAKVLHVQGESIRNIAAILKMSEAKVRAAINTTI